MEELLKDILEAAKQYYEKLRHLESLQAYFHVSRLVFLLSILSIG